MIFDVDYDHRLDSKGKDPDTHSPTLKLQHQLLWNKPLPNGSLFNLQPEPGKYLIHSAGSESFHLSSDSISHSLRKQKRMQPLISQIPPKHLDEFQSTGSVIGARILFPGNRIENRFTINQARGTHPRINDRFDLTLECIRMHYSGISSPLESVLNRYRGFFSLFRDFRGYVEFFFLQDLVLSDYSEVLYFIPHDPAFKSSPRPDSVERYMHYQANTTSFVKARNARISDWAAENLS